MAVEVDLSGISASTQGAPIEAEDVDEIARRPIGTTHATRRGSARCAFRHYDSKSGNVDKDRQFCVSLVLTYLGVANPEEAALHARYAEGTLIRPKRRPRPREAWARLLLHPEQELLTGEIFASVAPAVLMGRLSALRRDKALPRLEPGSRQDPATSTLQAVRCFSWAAAILGMAPPLLHADAGYAGMVEMVPGMPPATRIGAEALAGRSTSELAFLAGRHVAYHRAENFHAAPRPEHSRPGGHFPGGAQHRKPRPPAERAGPGGSSFPSPRPSSPSWSP